MTQCVSFLPAAAKSLTISGPVVASWNFQLASFSNWWQRNQPCFAQSSSALRTMPVPLPALGVTMTLAPSMRMRRRRSTEKGSAMQMTQS